MSESEDSKRALEAREQRLDALERIFGQHSHMLISPIPYVLGGDPTFVCFPDYIPDADVWCTTEMAGDVGSGQRPGPSGEFELVMVVPKGSDLAPAIREATPTSEQFYTKGWVGVLLTAMAKYSCMAVLKGGDTAGPTESELKPMTALLLHELTNDKFRFEFGGASYGLLLLMLITENEFRFAKSHNSKALVKKLREAKHFPLSDLSRPSVC